MRRSEARENAFLILFECSFTENADVDAVIEGAVENMEYKVDDFCRGIVSGVQTALEDIDAKINKYSDKWKTNRLSRVALIAARIAVYEIDGGNVPAPVAVNEAVELIKKYDTEESARYINGVLGTYVRK